MRLLLAVAALLSFSNLLRASEVHVFAAASLTDALKALAPAYAAKSGNRLVFNLAGSNALARQIQAGAPADVFFSADEIQMDRLAKAGFVDVSSRRDLLSNTLVIVVPPDGPAALDPAALARTSVKRVALADPKSVPAGVYAREYLTKLGLWKAIEPKVVPTENVRAALAAVESGNVEAGIVYRLDAAISKAARTAFEVPRAEGPKIAYPAAIVSGAENAAAAKDFLDYLASAEGMAVFQKFGFLPVGG